MKRQIHQVLLGLSLFVIIPGALFGILLAVAVVGSGIQSGFSPTDFVAMPLLLAPAILGWWGVRLCFRLYVGFLASVRRSLFWFYAAMMSYCGMWLISIFSRDGITHTIFALHEQVIGMILLPIPLLTVIFMSADPNPKTVASNEEAQ